MKISRRLLEKLRRPVEGKRKTKKKSKALSKVKKMIEEQRDIRALVDSDDIHCLMIGASGVGKTAFFLYPNLEYACACGMSYLALDTKGDLARNYGCIASKYYGYQVTVIDLRNPTCSDGFNFMTLVNHYMDRAKRDPNDLTAKAKAENYAKILAKTIVSPEGSSQYGDNAFFYETTPYDPHSPYSASKASSDMLVKAYMDTYHFPANITNCSNNYGPFQFPEKLIPLIINNALHGKKLPVYGDGKNVRDWLYVEDHAKAIDMVQEQGRLFETYNVGGHNEKQNIEIIHIIIETLQEMLPDSDPRKAHINNDLITYVEDRKGHDRRYAIAPDKIKAEIGWYPETMFKEGIRKTIAWYFEHEDWMNNVTSGDYQKYYNEMYEEK